MPTKIPWADETWPVATGCTHAGSPGCDNCYAARMAATRLKHHPRYTGLARYHNGKARWTGKVNFNHDVLEQPLRWRKPRMIFVCSMSDLFHEKLHWSVIEKVFMTMIRARQHTFQVLTKRAERAYDFVQTCFPDLAECSPHIWGLVTAENQATADERIPWLLKTPFAVRGVSVEPMLGAVDLEHYLGIWTDDVANPHQRLVVGRSMIPNLFTALARPEWARLYKKQLSWVIGGGESGPGARPMHLDWARSLRDQCQAAGVPFFFKQWGAWAPSQQVDKGDAWENVFLSPDGSIIPSNTKPAPGAIGTRVWRFGKKAAGHLLDGREHHEFPRTD